MRFPRAGMLATAALLVLSACASPHHPTTSSPSSSTPAVRDSCSDYAKPGLSSSGPFDGHNAMARVLGIVCDFSVSPPRENPRVPSTPGRDAAGRYLMGQLGHVGWSVSYENFTGRDYDGLPKGSVASWSTCPAAARERMLDLTFANLVAQRGSGGRLTILMAHYESKLHANQDPNAANRSKPVLGANDGASGVGVLVEAARVISSERAGTVRILLVDGEDGFEDCHPLAGSIYHAQHLSAADRDRLEAVLLLDMVGDPNAHFCLAGNSLALAERLRAAARNASASAVSQAPDCSTGLADDHTAFTDLGLPAIDLIDYDAGFPPYWHTAADTPDKLSPDMLGQVGRATVGFAG